MRIVVNDIAASKTGAMTVLRDFYNCVKVHGTSHEWIFLLGDAYLEETENIKVLTYPKVKNSGFKKLLFDFFTGKKVIEKLKPDVYFSLQNITCFGLSGIKKITYIHQSLPFQKMKKFSFFKNEERSSAIYQYLIGSIIKLSAEKSSLNIVQTEWMRKEVCKQCRLSDEKVVKVRPNLKNINCKVTEENFNYSCFFYPTSTMIYKNNQCIYDAAKLLDEKGLNFNVKLTINNNEQYKHIEHIGVIPYEKVLSEYTRNILIFPSYIETFGYPLVEAREVGTIILASDCPFSRELLNGYSNAYFFNPFHPVELANLMADVISGKIKLINNTDEREMHEHDTWCDVIDIIISQH